LPQSWGPTPVLVSRARRLKNSNISILQLNSTTASSVLQYQVAQWAITGDQVFS
jgi:hypothetical protein